MATEVEKLLVTLEANVGDYSKDIAQAAAQTDASLSKAEASFSDLNKAVDASMSAASARVKQATDQIAAGLSGIGRQALIAQKSNEQIAAGFASLGKSGNQITHVTDSIALGMSSAGKAAAENAPKLDTVAAGLSNVGKAALAAQVNSELFGSSAEEAGHAAEGLSAQGQAAFHSIRSVAEQLALGIPPTQALTGQLNHLSFAASGPGGVSGAFSEVLSVFSKIFTPIRLAVGGVAALAAAGVAAAVSFANAQSKVSLALSGIGGAAGVTANDVDRIATSVAKTGDVSEGEARDIATAIASTGKASADATAKATLLAKSYSLIFNKDLTKSAEDLGAALADPAKGIEDLNGRLGAFNDAEVQAVKTMATQNNLAGAQNIILNGLNRSLGDATQKTTAWSHAWDLFANSVSNAYTAVGRAIDQGLGFQDPVQALADAQARLKALQQPGASGGLGRRGLFADPSAIAATTAEVQRLQAAVDALKKSQEDAANNRESVDFGNIVRGIDPSISKLTELEATLDRVNADLANPKLTIDEKTRTAAQNASAALTGQIALEKQYLELSKQRFGLTNDILGATAAQSDIELRAINARTPAEKAEVAYLLTLKQLRDQGQSVEAATAGATLARTKALVQSYHDLSEAARDRAYQAGQQIEQGNIENSLIGRSVDVSTRATAAFQLLAAAKQEAFKNGTTVSLEEQVRALADADELARQAVTNARDRTVADANFAISQLARTQSEQSVYSTLQSAGLLDNGKIVSAQAEEAAAVLRTKEAFSQLADAEKDFASTLGHDLLEGKNLADSLGDALKNVASKLVDLGIDKLISGANTSLLPALGSLFGFADGGVMVPGKGPASLPRFAGGGVSRSAAIFGEAGPEAAVPLPDGRRIPVDLRVPNLPTPVATSGAPQINFNAPLISAPNATSEGVDKINSTSIPALKRMIRGEISQAFDRNAKVIRKVRGQ